MTQKLAVRLCLFSLLVIALPACRADWVYQQYPGDKMVSFSHDPEASAEQLEQARLALEKLPGVQKAYVKGNSVSVVKDPKLPWGQVWSTITTAIYGVRSDVRPPE